MIVPFPPGGATDIIGRLLAAKMQAVWGQPVVVENRPGAGTVVGTDLVAKSAPDGHTLGVVVTAHMINPSLRPNMPFDTLKDLAAVGQVSVQHLVIAAHPSLEANSVAELIALAKKKPGELAYSSSGPGGAPHLAMELFKRQAKIDLTHIPYKGSSMSINDLIGGRVMLSMDSLVQSAPHIKSGRLKALAVLGPKRSPLLPEVPTMQEAGVAGYSLTNWFGLLAPAATPKETVLQIHRDVIRVLKDPDIIKRIGDLGADVVGNTPEEFGAAMRAESLQWAEIIKAVGIKGE